jgi:iron complex outermembrane receptor protein
MLIGAEYYADRFEGSGARENSTPNPSAYYIRLPNPWDVTRNWNTEFQYLNPIADFSLSPRPEALAPISKGDDRETTGYAVYLTDQIAMMNERLRLLGGVRYERFYTDNFITGAEGDENDITFQAGAMYQLLPWLSLFANYSESFYRNEFYNQFGPPGMAGKMAPPQQGEGIDIGFKLDDPKGRWSGTISYYDLSQKNILINVRDENNNTLQRLAGARESTGFEFDFHFAPTPSWQILLNYAYVSTKDVDTGTAFPNVPKHQGSVFTRYEFTEGPLAGFALGGGAVYMGDRPGGNDSNIVSQNWDFVAESYIAVDAFISRNFAWRTHELTIQFNVSNLTDEEYIRGGQTLPSEPRRYTLSLTFDY